MTQIQADNGNFAALVFAHADRNPDRLGLVMPKSWTASSLVESEEVTYGQLIERTRAMMAGLHAEGFGAGDRIVIAFPLCLDSFPFILALYAMQTLPINYAGLLLILFGVILFIAEINIMSYGLLSVSGAISIFLGSIMLIDSDDPAMQISKMVLYPTLGVTFLLAIGTIYLARKSHQLRTTTGVEGLVGETGVVKVKLNPQGSVLIHGETWNAESDITISDGEKVVVEAVEGLKIKVRKAGE